MKSKCSSIVVALVVILLMQARATIAGTRYTYIGRNFTQLSTLLETPPAGWQNVSTSNHLTITLAFDAPLQASLTQTNVTPTFWSISDGIHRVDQSSGALSSCSVGTNTLGEINIWDISVSGKVDNRYNMALVSTGPGPSAPAGLDSSVARDPTNNLIIGGGENINTPGVWSHTMVGPLIDVYVGPNNQTLNPAYSSVAYDPARNRFLVAWTNKIAEYTYDTWARFIGSDGSLQGEPFQINTDTSCALANLGFDSQHGRYLAVFSCGIATYKSVIKGVFIDAGDNTLGPLFAISPWYNQNDGLFPTMGVAGLVYDPIAGRFLVLAGISTRPTFNCWPCADTYLYGRFVSSSVEGNSTDWFKIADTPSPGGITSIAAAFDSKNHHFMVAYAVYYGYSPIVKGSSVKILDAEGGTLSSQELSADTNYYFNSAIYNPINGQFLVSWEPYPGYGPAGAVLDANGNRLPTMDVSLGNFSDVTAATIDETNQRYLVVGNGPGIGIGQHFNLDGTPYGDWFPIAPVDLWRQALFLTSGSPGKSLVVWGDSGDIFGKMVETALPAAPPPITSAGMNIYNIIRGSGPEGTGEIEYGYEVHIQAKNASNVTVDNLKLAVGGVELQLSGFRRVEYDGDAVSISAYGPWDPAFLGEYCVALRNNDGPWSDCFGIGVLGDYPKDAPETIYPQHGQKISQVQPTFQWEAFQTIYAGNPVSPFGYEVNLVISGSWYSAWPVRPDQTSLDYFSARWDSQPPALTPGIYDLTVHSVHNVSSGFSFEHHRGIQFEVVASAPEIKTFIDQSASAGSLVGTGPRASATKQVKAFGNMIAMANDLILIGDTAGACVQLADAYSKCDGSPRPPDLVTGQAATDVAVMVSDLMDALKCPR